LRHKEKSRPFHLIRKKKFTMLKSTPEDLKVQHYSISLPPDPE